MTGTLSRMLPWVLIAGGTSIIQYHSIAFWADHVDSSIGWAWSIMIEATGLWLWYRPGWPSRALALIASLLLLAGPLYQIAMPAVHEARTEDARAAQIKAQQEADAQLVRMLRTQNARDARLMHTYAQNSEKRAGWLPAIQGIQKRMDDAGTQINTLLLRKVKVVENKGMGVFLLVLLQALGLMLLQVSNVLAITHISRRARACIKDARERTVDARMEESHPPVEAIKNEPCMSDARVCTDMHTLARQVHAWMESERLSIARAAMAMGVDRPNLSYLLNWQEQGDRMPSRETTERIHNKIMDAQAVSGKA